MAEHDDVESMAKTENIYMLLIYLVVIWLVICFVQTLTLVLMHYNSGLNDGAIWFRGSLLEKFSKTGRFLGFSN